MAQKLNRATIAAHADLHNQMPVASQVQAAVAPVDRNFELPRGLYVTTVICYLAFLATTALAFSSPGLIIPMAILAVLMVVGFGLPTIWTKLSPDATAPDSSAPVSSTKSKSWARFQREGINSLTGHNTAGAATVQVLILPVLIVVWGLAVVTIAAIVR